MNDKIADILKAEREAAGLSQETLASAAGISTRYYQYIESGANQPSLEILFKLCDGLGCHYSVILEPVWRSWLKHK